MKPSDYGNRKAISTLATAAMVVLLLVVAGSVAYFVFVLYPQSIHPGSSTGGTSSGGGSGSQPVIQSLGVEWTSANTLGAGSVSESSEQYNFYGYQGSQLSSISSLYGVAPALSSISKSTQTTYYPSSKDLAGGFVLMSAYAGSNVYPDTSKILASNPAVDNFKWMSVTTTGRNDLVIEIQLSKLAVNTAVSPNAAFTFTNNVFVQTTLSSVTLTDAYTSHQVLNIGTTANTVTTIKATLGAVSSLDGAAIASIAIGDNDSTSAPTVFFQQPLSFGDVQPALIPAISAISNNGGATQIANGNFQSTGYISSSLTVNLNLYPGNAGTSTSQIQNSIIIDNPQNSLGDTTLNLPVTTSLASNAEINFKWTVTLISGAGVLQTPLTDTITLCAAAAHPC